jgi:hypothetical protein
MIYHKTTTSPKDNNTTESDGKFQKESKMVKSMFETRRYTNPAIVESLVRNTLRDILNSNINENDKQQYLKEFSKMSKEINEILKAENKSEIIDLGPVLPTYTRSGRIKTFDYS